MPSLRLLPAATGPVGKLGEALCCAYFPDGSFVVAGGWDGHLRLWDSATGAHVSAFKVSDKQVSACSVSPDGKGLVSGGLDGMLAIWDPVSHHVKIQFLAHTRPISGIHYSPDGRMVATASWDNTVKIWMSLRQHDVRELAGHRDIVSGCRFAPDGQSLLSWSHDTAVILWDVHSGRPLRELLGHEDRVLVGGISPDGKHAATGSRDGLIKLWDLEAGREHSSARLRGEVHGCLFLYDGQLLIAVDDHGRLTLHALPNLAIQAELQTKAGVHACDLSPTGQQLALACSDGRVHLVAVEGVAEAPLLVPIIRVTRRVAGPIQRLFGRSNLVYVYQCSCLACRHTFDVETHQPGTEFNCPGCGRGLRLSGITRIASEKESR